MQIDLILKINVIYSIKSLKKENHMILSIYAKINRNSSSIPMRNTPLKKLGIESNILKLMNLKSIANIILKAKD